MSVYVQVVDFYYFCDEIIILNFDIMNENKFRRLGEFLYKFKVLIILLMFPSFLLTFGGFFSGAPLWYNWGLLFFNIFLIGSQIINIVYHFKYIPGQIAEAIALIVSFLITSFFIITIYAINPLFTFRALTEGFD